MNQPPGQTPPLVLTSENWLTWSSVFTAKMEIANLATALTDARTEEDFPNHLVRRSTLIEYNDWVERSKKCMAHMILNVGEEFLAEVTKATNANEAWTNLKKRVHSLSQLGTSTLYSKLLNTRKSAEESVRSHLDTMNKNRQLLASLGKEHFISEPQWMSYVINSIPPTPVFESTVIALGRLLTTGNCTIDDITNQLMEAERVHEASKAHQEAAMISTMSGKSVKRKFEESFNDVEPSRSRQQCNFCQRSGHNEAQCWDKHENLRPRRGKWKRGGRRQQQPNNNNQGTPIQAQVHSTNIEGNWPYLNVSANVSILCCSSIAVNESNLIWYVDSAASRHFAYSKDIFMNLKEIPKIPVRFGNDTLLFATGIGDVMLKMREGTNQQTITLRNVMYVPGLTLNLLSVAELVKQGYWVAFGQPGCSFIDSTGNVVCTATCDPETNLFKIKSSSVKR